MDPSDGKELFRQARRLYQKKQYVDALGRFQAINEAFPNNPDILHPLARCLIKLKRLDEAREIHAFLLKVRDSRAGQIAERLAAAGGTPAAPPAADAGTPAVEGDSGSAAVDTAFDTDHGEEAETPQSREAPPPASPGDDEGAGGEPEASPRQARQAASAPPRRFDTGRGALRAAGTVLVAQGTVTAFYAVSALAMCLVIRRYTPISPFVPGAAAAMLAFALLSFAAAASVARGKRALARLLAVVSLIFVPAGTVCGVTVLVNLAHSRAGGEATE